jgi:hypothetical protein
VIERIAGPRVAVVDSAFTTSVAVEDLLDAIGARTDSAAIGANRIATTGPIGPFRTVAERVFGQLLPEVESLDTIGVTG